MPEEQRECHKCGVIRPISMFAFRDKAKNIRQYMCRVCVKKYNDEYRKKNCEKIKVNKKLYDTINRDKVLDRKRQYYKENYERIRDYRSEYYQKNKKKEREYMREYTRNRVKNDPLFRLKLRITKRIREGIKRGKLNVKWRDLLGCSVEFVKTYLEKKFYDHPISKKKMTWENYGEWEIDHIVPVSSISTMKDVKKIHSVFHYSNLQPLWKEENLDKRAKLKWDSEKYWKEQKK